MICLADMSGNRHEILQSTQITDPERRPLATPPADPGCRHEGLLRGRKARSRGRGRTAGVGFESGPLLSMIDDRQKLENIGLSESMHCECG